MRAGDASEAVVEERRLSQGRISLGRGADVDWTIPDPTRVVSKRHCQFLCADGGDLQLLDTSANGVFVNGGERAPSGHAMTLRTGDRVRVGDFVVAVSAVSPFDDPFRKPEPAPDPWVAPQQTQPFSPAQASDPFAIDPSRRSTFEQGDWGPEPSRRPSDGWVDALPEPARRQPSALSDAFERPVLAQQSVDASAFEIPTGWHAWNKEPELPESAPAQPEPPHAKPAPLPPIPAPPVPTGGDYAAGVRAALGWFVAGAGLDTAKFETADAQTVLKNAGAAYAQAILGIADVLRDRAFTRNEYRIQMTQIGVGNNNPLKFLPPQDAAVALLNPIIPGLMGPQESLNAACQDVKKHHLALLAGMRAAVHAAFEQMNPTRAEAQLKRAGGLSGLTETGRQANAWVEYLRYFQAQEEEATESPDSPVNREFRRGYEESLVQLDQAGIKTKDRR